MPRGFVYVLTNRAMPGRRMGQLLALHPTKKYAGTLGEFGVQTAPRVSEVGDVVSFAEALMTLKVAAAVMTYVVITYVMPWRIMQISLRRHYREWIGSTAYWQRCYDKWIIGNRIFYTDEFWSDILVSLLCGGLLGSVGYAIFLRLMGLDSPQYFYLAPILSTTVLLFISIERERVCLIDSELDVKKLVDPSFDNEKAIQSMIDTKAQWVRRVLGRE